MSCNCDVYSFRVKLALTFLTRKDTINSGNKNGGIQPNFLCLHNGMHWWGICVVRKSQAFRPAGENVMVCTMARKKPAEECDGR